MKTIDLTPTWEQWTSTVMKLVLHSSDPANTLKILMKDFENMARLADQQVANLKNKKQ